MLDKLEEIKIRFKDLEQRLGDPALISDMKKYKQVNKEYKSLEPIMEAYEVYKNVCSNLEYNRNMLKTEKDSELREMALMEIEEGEKEKEELESKINIMMIPDDPNDDKNIILEIRAGTGGDEASIFAGDLLRMYLKYIESKGWQATLMSESEGTAGGYKEVILEVTGEKVYGTMKYESGVHRVQRVPKTESQGRIHTSAASVAVLAEADEVDIEINPADLRIDTYRASGAGGQHVNKTESAVRITHIPTGTVAECQDGRSQHKNKEMAMTMLRTRIFEQRIQAHEQEIASRRKTLVSTGDRSAKIRTYNWPQGRVTDHRINLTMYNLEAIINGDIEEIIEQLRSAENAEKLKSGETI